MLAGVDESSTFVEHLCLELAESLHIVKSCCVYSTKLLAVVKSGNKLIDIEVRKLL